MFKTITTPLLRALRKKLGIRGPSRLPPYTLLTDLATGAVLAVSYHPAAISFLKQTMPDTEYVPNANYPKYAFSFPLVVMPPEQYHLWAWTRSRELVPIRPDVITDRLKERSALAVAKRNVLNRVINDINAARSRRLGIVLQDHIYLLKSHEAQRFKANNYDESDILSYPYVLQYADVAGISMRDAADDIIFKAKMSNDELARTEFLRLKFFGKIRDAQTPAELPAISEEFTRELYINAVL